MTIYVDELFTAPHSPRWPYTQACHLFTDGSEEELHVFAEKLGLKRAWFQRHPTSAPFPKFVLHRGGLLRELRK